MDIEIWTIVQTLKTTRQTHVWSIAPSTAKSAMEAANTFARWVAEKGESNTWLQIDDREWRTQNTGRVDFIIQQVEKGDYI